MAKRKRSPFAYAMLTICVLGFAYVGANSYAMALGATHHDASCPDH